MLKKLKAGWELLQAGKRVADPALWKARQITATMLVAAMWAGVQAAQAFGIDIPVTEEALDGLAIGIISMVNFVLTVATTNKIDWAGTPVTTTPLAPTEKPDKPARKLGPPGK